MKAVVLTGAGKGFCGGGNVDEIIGVLLERDVAETLKFTRMTGAVVRNMQRLDKPIVAAVNGMAAGAGAVLALASDIRILSDQARSCRSVATMSALCRASELLLLGDNVDARECLRIGLANKVVPHDQLTDEAMGIARRLAAGPGLALGMTKRMLVNESGMDLNSAIEQEAQAQALLLRARDHREFYEAWKAKRTPRFEGR